MAHRKLTTLQLAAFLLLAAVSSAVLAQQPVSSPSLWAAQPPQTAPDPTTPTLKVKATLTVEDVTVTDGKDKPVHGLMQPDFTIKEDGKPQPIKNFQEYTASATQVQAPPLQLPPGTYTNRQAAAPSAVNILLLDDVATGAGGTLVYAPQNVVIAKQEAIKYLKTMPEGTQVAILKLTDGLSVVQGFTSNRDILLAAVDSFKPERVEGAYFVPPPPMAPPEATLEALCAAANKQSEVTTAGLAGMTSLVSGIKGRKNLIWFTPGIPWLTDYGRYSHVPCLRDYSPQLHNAYGLLNAARVAVYPISPKGLEGGCDVQGADETVPCTMGTLMEDHGSVQDIANNTGGKAYYNRNDLDAAIGEAIANGSDYYSLSYVPPLSKYDGKYHTIDVKVDRPGMNLLYREGYTALDAQQPREKNKTDKKNSSNAAAPPVSGFHAAMGYGKPDAAELPFNVTVQPATQPSQLGGSSGSKALGSPNPRLKGTPLVRYDFLYEMPAGDITLTSDDPADIQKGSVEFVVAAYSANGELLNSLGQTATFTIKPDQVARFMQQSRRIPVQLDLPPGKVFLRIGVLDVPSQKMGILEIPQTVAKE